MSLPGWDDPLWTTERISVCVRNIFWSTLLYVPFLVLWRRFQFELAVNDALPSTLTHTFSLLSMCYGPRVENPKPSLSKLFWTFQSFVYAFFVVGLEKVSPDHKSKTLFIKKKERKATCTTFSAVTKYNTVLPYAPQYPPEINAPNLQKSF